MAEVARVTYGQGMALSVFDLFSIGIGPSSSHTVGPMRAALMFVRSLEADGQLDRVTSLRVELYGSLGATGHGHGSDKAVLLGLSGEAPELVDPRAVEGRLAHMRATKRLALLGRHEIDFDEATDLAKAWVTLVWDDPVNLMSYVTHVFTTYFGHPLTKAEQLMLQVHNEGKAIVSSGTREEMERDVAAMHDYGLWATVDRAA